MKKKISVIIFVIILVVGYFIIFFLQNILLTKSYVRYNEGQGKDSFIRCNYNILKPKFATVFWALEKGHIGFKPTNIFLMTNEEWENSYAGGTTIKNTTFPELLKMVKQDCEQFQKGKGSGDDKTINWIYYQNNPDLDDIRKEIREDKEDYTESEYLKEIEKKQKPLKGKELEQAAKELKEMYTITDEQLQPILEKLKEGKIPDMRDYEFR